MKSLEAKLLNEIYDSYQIEKEERRDFRRALEEYFHFLDQDFSSGTPLAQQLDEKIVTLKAEFDEGKKGVSFESAAREVEHLNILFNRMKRLKFLTDRIPRIEELLLRLIEDEQFRNRVASDIEKEDYEEHTLWSRVKELYLYALGGRPK